MYEPAESIYHGKDDGVLPLVVFLTNSAGASLGIDGLALDKSPAPGTGRGCGPVHKNMGEELGLTTCYCPLQLVHHEQLGWDYQDASREPLRGRDRLSL